MRTFTVLPSAPPGHPMPVFVDRSDVIQNLITTVGAMIKQGMIAGGEAKYLELMQEGDVFDLEDMEKYTVRKGVEKLDLYHAAVRHLYRGARLGQVRAGSGPRLPGGGFPSRAARAVQLKPVPHSGPIRHPSYGIAPGFEN
jgi:hypothetical protein